MGSTDVIFDMPEPYKQAAEDKLKETPCDHFLDRDFCVHCNPRGPLSRRSWARKATWKRHVRTFLGTERNNRMTAEADIFNAISEELGKATRAWKANPTDDWAIGRKAGLHDAIRIINELKYISPAGKLRMDSRELFVRWIPPQKIRAKASSLTTPTVKSRAGEISHE